MLDIKKKKTTDMSSVQKTVLITGGSRGIGAATAKKLAEEGYFVIINYINGKVDAENLVNEIDQFDKLIVCRKINGDASVELPEP